MSVFAVCSRGWRSGNNSCHNLLTAHLKKTALPPINNFAPQQKIYTENRDIHSRTENDLHSFRWCIQLNCIMLSPQSLREAIVKSDVSLVIRLCLKVILIFENFKPSQKKRWNSTSVFQLFLHMHIYILKISREIINWKDKVQPLKKSLKSIGLGYSVRLFHWVTLSDVLSLPIRF